MDILDWEKVGKVDTLIKVGVWIAAAILVFVAIKDQIGGASKNIAANVEKISEIEEQISFLGEQEASFDYEKVVYGTLCIIASEKGAEHATPSMVKNSLTTEEASLVAKIVDDMSYDGDSESQVIGQMNDRGYLVDYYGVANAGILFDIANAHLKEWK